MAREAKPWFYRQTGWWMAYIGGRKVRLAEGRDNRRAAKQRLTELLAEAARNPAPDHPDQTVASVIETYLATAGSDLAPNTLTRYTEHLQDFAEAHGWRPIKEAKPLHLEMWLKSKKGWVSGWTQNGALRDIFVAFNWAARMGVIPSNPFKGVTRRVGKRRRPMTPEEFQAILRVTNSSGHWKRRPTPGARFREILIFLWFTGCRPSEAAGLVWSHVDFDKKLIILPEHKTIRTQRDPMPRVIPLHPVVDRLLQTIRKRDEGERVFVNHRKTPWRKDTLVYRMKRARDAAGLPKGVSLYCIRHAFGTRGAINGCELKTLSALMGHTTTRMTEHYVTLAGQHAHLAAAMLRVNARRSDV